MSPRSEGSVAPLAAGVSVSHSEAGITIAAGETVISRLRTKLSSRQPLLQRTILSEFPGRLREYTQPRLLDQIPEQKPYIVPAKLRNQLSQSAAPSRTVQ